MVAEHCRVLQIPLESGFLFLVLQPCRICIRLGQHYGQHTVDKITSSFATFRFLLSCPMIDTLGPLH